MHETCSASCVPLLRGKQWHTSFEFHRKSGRLRVSPYFSPGRATASQKQCFSKGLRPTLLLRSSGTLYGNTYTGEKSGLAPCRSRSSGRKFAERTTTIHVLGNHRRQVLSIHHRLRHVIVAARVEALLAVLSQGAGTHRDDRPVWPVRRSSVVAL